MSCPPGRHAELEEQAPHSSFVTPAAEPPAKPWKPLDLPSSTPVLAAGDLYKPSCLRTRDHPSNPKSRERARGTAGQWCQSAAHPRQARRISVGQAGESKMSGIAEARLREERKAWRRDHPVVSIVLCWGRCCAWLRLRYPKMQPCLSISLPLSFGVRLSVGMMNEFAFF